MTVWYDQLLLDDALQIAEGSKSPYTPLPTGPQLAGALNRLADEVTRLRERLRRFERREGLVRGALEALVSGQPVTAEMRSMAKTALERDVWAK